MSQSKAKTVATSNPYQQFIEGKDPIRVLAATHKKLVKLLDGLTPSQLAAHPIPGKWSIQEVVRHLVDDELIYSVRCRWIVFEENPTLVPFDQNSWAHGRTLEKEPVAESLGTFRLLRQAQLRLIRNLPAASLNRYGSHGEFGKISLKLYIPWMAGHDLNHLSQIAALREKLLLK
ncbi:MAG TPA: DinB family protein [Blastocatellia bacterium]|nr:DinB family protein [Blastocatellia bacterium]